MGLDPARLLPRREVYVFASVGRASGVGGAFKLQSSLFRPLTHPPTGGMIVPVKHSDPTVTKRMNYLSGHLQANLKMIEGGRYCIDIIHQNQAVISALRKVNEIILRNHLESCVTTAIRGKSEAERQRMFAEIVSVFQEGEKDK